MRVLNFFRFVVALAAVTGILAGCSEENEVDWSPGTMPPPAARQNVTYTTDIKPIFEASCFKCHGENKQKAELRLDDLQAAVYGSENGPVFYPGESLTSVLVSNVARLGDEDDWMPPIDKGKPLTTNQVALIRAWIDQGAK